MKNQAFLAIGIDYDYYVRWCNVMNKKVYLQDSRKEFFKLFNEGKIKKDKSGIVYYENQVL